jgi:(1->4)-alpha-D-glucan 1-alpha-D-glucosylmutase
LESEGNLKEYVCAFARQKEGKTVLVIVPRFLTHLIRDTDDVPLGERVWEESWVVPPKEINGGTFRNLFTDEIIEEVRRNGEGLLSLGKVFANFPVAMLEKV